MFEIVNRTYPAVSLLNIDVEFGATLERCHLILQINFHSFKRDIDFTRTEINNIVYRRPDGDVVTLLHIY